MSSSKGTSAPSRRGRYNGRRVSEATKAQHFFEQKLVDNPTMPRYNHCLGALADAKGKMEEATGYYRNAAANQPANLMIRNDYALHLEKKGFHKDALREYDKALLVSLDSAAIHMNLAAVHGRHGEYRTAVEHAQRAKDLNPDIPMNLRNLAKMQAHTGNTRKALANNLDSIRLVRVLYCTVHTHTHSLSLADVDTHLISPHLRSALASLVAHSIPEPSETPRNSPSPGA